MQFTLHVAEEHYDKVMEISLHGELGTDDYARFVPETERMIQEYGKMRLLVRLLDFDGWDPGALWQDIKWNVKHFNHIERLGVVGEETWQKWMTGFCNAFTTAEVRYFTPDQFEAARAWMNE